MVFKLITIPTHGDIPYKKGYIRGPVKRMWASVEDLKKMLFTFGHNNAVVFAIDDRFPDRRILITKSNYKMDQDTIFGVTKKLANVEKQIKTETTNVMQTIDVDDTPKNNIDVVNDEISKEDILENPSVEISDNVAEINGTLIEEQPVDEITSEVTNTNIDDVEPVDDIIAKQEISADEVITKQEISDESTYSTEQPAETANIENVNTPKYTYNKKKHR